VAETDVRQNADFAYSRTRARSILAGVAQAPQKPRRGSRRWLERDRLQDLLAALQKRGYEVRGPVAKDGALAYEPVRRVEELAIGYREQQKPGGYRLEHVGDERIFGVVNGPGSLKPLVFAPTEALLTVKIEDARQGFRAEAIRPDSRPVAVLGVRPCDVAALRVQDRIFLEDRYPDPYYAARRRNLFVIAVNCTRSAPTCFCTSMETGPEATEGFDLVLTELEGGFTASSGSASGRELLESLSLSEAPESARSAERSALDACAAGIDRRLDTSDLPEALYRALDHARWDEVGERCLSCGNCTMVCPTCFCHDERDEPQLDGRGSVRVREWDSCFDRAHARIHGKDFRPRPRDRYRQWLVHKLASWVDQFDTSGCVGCGRCITWCPVGIDLTEEVAALREEPR